MSLAQPTPPQLASSKKEECFALWQETSKYVNKYWLDKVPGLISSRSLTQSALPAWLRKAQVFYMSGPHSIDKIQRFVKLNYKDFLLFPKVAAVKVMNF